MALNLWVNSWPCLLRPSNSGKDAFSKATIQFIFNSINSDEHLLRCQQHTFSVLTQTSSHLYYSLPPSGSLGPFNFLNWRVCILLRENIKHWQPLQVCSLITLEKFVLNVFGFPFWSLSHLNNGRCQTCVWAQVNSALIYPYCEFK